MSTEELPAVTIQKRSSERARGMERKVAMR
jgi:hypothetical protein